MTSKLIPISPNSLTIQAPPPITPRHRTLSTLLAISALLLGSPAFAKGTASQQANLSLQQKCADETAQADHWIRWAAETKRDCFANHSQSADREACLLQAKRHLMELEREHAAIYTGQISSLPSNHPVVVSLLSKLRSNAQAAQTAIDTEQEPTHISSTRHAQCLKQR